MSETAKGAKLSDLKDGEVKVVNVGGGEVALYRIGDEVFAIENICTHVGCVISENNNIEGEEVECTCHGSRFNIKTGAVTNPPATKPLKTYSIKVKGEDVLVKI